MPKIFKSLTFWVLAGGALGYTCASLLGSQAMLDAGESHPVYGVVLLLKTSFIKMLFMLIAPVVFFSLIDGLVSIRDQASIKRLGSLTVGYYLLTTGIAIAIGLTAVLVYHPWTDSDLRMGTPDVASGTEEHRGGPTSARSDEVGASAEARREPGPPRGSVGQRPAASYTRIEPGLLISEESGSPTVILKGFLMKMFQNPFTALAEINILAIVMNAFLIGLAVILVLPRDSPLIRVLRDTNRVFHRILAWVILTAPVGVFAIVFDFKLHVSGDLFRQLFQFCAVVFAATALHGFVVLPLLGALLGGVPPHKLFARIGQPMFIALSTASSAATLPVTMKVCEEELGVSNSVASFVCPLGATMNMDGTALFEGIAAVFLAHLYGIELDTSRIIAIFAMAMVSSIGAPGMPSGSMSGMQMVLLASGIPLEAIGILLVVERPLDTFRTAVNVEGDIVGAVSIQRFMRRGERRRDGEEGGKKGGGRNRGLR